MAYFSPQNSPVSPVSHTCHAVSLRFHIGFIGFTRLVVECYKVAVRGSRFSLGIGSVRHGDRREESLAKAHSIQGSSWGMGRCLRSHCPTSHPPMDTWSAVVLKADHLCSATLHGKLGFLFPHPVYAFPFCVCTSLRTLISG